MVEHFTKLFPHRHQQVAIVVEDVLLFQEQASDRMPIAASGTRFSSEMDVMKSYDKNTIIAPYWAVLGGEGRHGAELSPGAALVNSGINASTTAAPSGVRSCATLEVWIVVFSRENALHWTSSQCMSR